MPPPTRRAFILKRILVSVLLGMLLAALTSEVAYRWLRRENREPQRVQLIIPPGTAQKVAQGAAAPGIPNDMTFVLGDTLVVVNQDEVDHRLGPLWIPAGASASLNLSREQDEVLECSFRPDNYLGLKVFQPVTLGTRLTGILFAGFPLSALFAVYSILIGKDEKREAPA